MTNWAPQAAPFFATSGENRLGRLGGYGISEIIAGAAAAGALIRNPLGASYSSHVADNIVRVGYLLNSPVVAKY